jgi:hypothetical protein
VISTIDTRSNHPDYPSGWLAEIFVKDFEKWVHPNTK